MILSGRMGLVLASGVLVLAVGCAVGGFLLAGAWYPGSAGAVAGTQGEYLDKMQSFGKVRTTAPPPEVAALGRLEPQGRVSDVSGLLGDRLARLEIAKDGTLVELREGDEVKKDQVIGYLDTYQVRKAQYEAAVAQLKDAEARLKTELASAEAMIAEAETAVRQAKELDPLDIKAQEAKVRLLESEEKTVQADLDRMKKLTSPGAVSAQKMDEQVQGVRRAQEELAAARATLAKVTAGQALNLQRSQAQLDVARAGKRKVEAALASDGPKQNVALAQAELDRSILKAPRDGRILQILVRPGEKVDQQPILKIGDTRVMYVVAEVYETDLPWVRQGQTATVASRTLAKPLSGKVERVGWLIARNTLLHVDPAAAADARVGRAWIRLDSAPEEIQRLTNLQVDVRIKTPAAK